MTRAPLLCPTCASELVAIGPAGAECVHGHFIARGADGRLQALRPADNDANAFASGGTAEAAPSEAESTDHGRERRSQADRAIGYALASGARFLVDQFGAPHVLVDGTPLALPRGAYSWLRRLVWEHEQRGITGEALQVAAGTLEALALHQGERVELYVRSAWHAASRSLFIWLGPRRILAIDAAGWRVQPDAPVLFRVYPTTGELPTPDGDGTAQARALGLTLDLVAPVEEAGRRLVLAWMATAWLEHVARPILLYHGDWGAGKSLRQRAIKRLIDPSKPESLRVDSRDLTQLLMHCQVAFFDNLGSLPEWAIDALCRAVTGEGDAKRRLYSDDDDFAYEYRRSILLNGINMPADRPDFTDRLLPIELERIPDDRREEEAAIWARLADAHPALLAALASLLSGAIARLDGVTLRRKPRLADWGRWAAAVYEAAGWGTDQFERDWQLVVERQQAAAVEGSPVAQALLRWFEDRSSWSGTASDLLQALTPVAEELGLLRAKGWPKSPVWLARRLRELRPVLAVHGIVAREREKHGGVRLWSLERSSEEYPRIPPPPPPDDRYPHDDEDLAGDGNDGGTVSTGAIPPPATRYRLKDGGGKPEVEAVTAAYGLRENPHGEAKGDAGDAGGGIAGSSSDRFSGSLDDAERRLLRVRREDKPHAPPRCTCGGVLMPDADYKDWLRCTRCRHFVRANAPAHVSPSAEGG